MPKTILITGSTDGIGLQAAQRLIAVGQRVILHGRNRSRLDAALTQIGAAAGYVADLSSVAGALDLAKSVAADHETLDVLINNAGVFKTAQEITNDEYDLRFMVNTIAPYALTRALLSIIPTSGRVVNLSSAAQAPFDLTALRGATRLAAQAAYAQSKLALTAWTSAMADQYPEGPSFVSVNPGSLLATKMVKEGYGIAGHDIGIGAKVLEAAALSDTFANRSGAYFDNDAGRFADPHGFAQKPVNRAALMAELDRIIQA